VTIIGAVVETFLGVDAEQKSLETWLCLSAPEAGPGRSPA